jgi:AcrR family transcriptional regulator
VTKTGSDLTQKNEDKTTRRPARGWERKKANRDTYEEILEAAGKAFSRAGYEGATLSSIAAEVGIKTPGLYYHFKSKSDLLFAYLQRVGSMIDKEIDSALAAAKASPDEQLYALLYTYTRLQLEQADVIPTVNNIIYSSTIGKVLTEEQMQWLRGWERAFLGRIQTQLKAGKRAGLFTYDDLTATTFFLMGAMDFCVNWYRPGGKLSIDRVSTLTADLGLRAVQKR